MVGEQLRVSEGKERGKRLSVATDLLIGRVVPEHDGRLGDDPEISRRHARVSRGADGKLTIEDLGSANGTFVNGERIDAPRTLAVGDVVKMGKTVLQVTPGAAEESPKPRPAPQTPAAEPPGAVAEAAAELVVTAGLAPGRRLTLRDELIIGRAVSGEGRLSDDADLSRRHARIARDARGRLTIEDLGSANGTFVNGQRVRGRQALNVGDSVQVGSTTLQLTEVGRAPSPPAPAPAPAPARVTPPDARAGPAPRPRPPPARPRRPLARPRAPRQPPVPPTGSCWPPSSGWAQSSRGAAWWRSSATETWESSTGPRSSRSNARWP